MEANDSSTNWELFKVVQKPKAFMQIASYIHL